MQITKTNKIIISMIVVAILFVAYVVFYDKSKQQNETANVDNNISTTTLAANVNLQGGGYKIEQIPINENNVPDLNRAVIVFPGAIISPETKALAIEKVKTLQTQLKKDPVDFSTWLGLGIYQKMGGDYVGASLSWQYASKIAETDYISLGNLGNLYAYFIKDNIKSETYYKQAISKSPTQAYLYIQLAEVYRDLFQDLTKARSIVDQGLSKIPNDANLLQLKASLSAL